MSSPSSSSIRWQNFERSPGKKKSEKTEPPPLLVSQARLNVIVQPSCEWYHQKTRWLRESLGLMDQELAERIAGLIGSCSELKALLDLPPPEWDGVRWTVMHHRLNGWEGQLSALQTEQEKRRASPR
jgi:hypothetical protein